MEGRSSSQLVHRWTKSLNPAITRKKWTPTEDYNLMRAVIIHGKHWSRIRDSNVLPGRSDAQIRERYTNCISLSSRGAFTPDEDKLIIQGVTEMGAQNWATIAKALKGRTDSQVAKRWKLIEEHKNQNKPLNYNWAKEGYMVRMQNLQKVRTSLHMQMRKEMKEELMQKAKGVNTVAETEKTLTPLTGGHNQLADINDELENRLNSVEGAMVRPDGSGEMTTMDIMKVYDELICKPSQKQNEKKKKLFTQIYLITRDTIIKIVRSKLRPMVMLSGVEGHPANLYKSVVLDEWNKTDATTTFSQILSDLNIDSELVYRSMKNVSNSEDSVQKEPQKKIFNPRQNLKPVLPCKANLFGLKKLRENRLKLERQIRKAYGLKSSSKGVRTQPSSSGPETQTSSSGVGTQTLKSVKVKQLEKEEFERRERDAQNKMNKALDEVMAESSCAEFRNQFNSIFLMPCLLRLIPPFLKSRTSVHETCTASKHKRDHADDEMEPIGSGIQNKRPRVA